MNVIVSSSGSSGSLNISGPGSSAVVSSGGASGPRGNAVFSGPRPPLASDGIDGDYWINTASYPTNAVLYGPKAAGAWPGSGVALGIAVGGLLAANNLSDLPNPAAGRASLGLGSAATQSTGAFDAAGAAAAVAAAIPAASGTVTSETSFGQASAAGTVGTFARGDHTHGTPSLPAASTSAAGLVQLAGDLAGTAASPQVTGTHLAAPLSLAQGGTGQSTATAAYNALAPETLLAPTGNATTDAAAINSAISAASTTGGGRVRLGPGAWTLSASITPRSGVVLCGTPATSVAVNFNGSIVYGSTTAFTEFVIEDLVFLGPVTSTPAVPTRARTTSGSGAQTAVYLSGDLDATGTGQAQLTNFTMRRCTVQNCSALPLRIGGVRGKVVVTNCSFINNQDVGFIYNADVQFENNYVYGSADNGVSVSRGNTKCTVVGNTFENCCYNGIWLSGFDDGTHNLVNIGPTYFACTGNTVINVGFNGIMLDQAPAHGVVSGNFVNQGYFRGASDQASDANGAGIYVGGYPTSARSLPTAWATDLVIEANTLYQCARAGIYVTGAKAVTIEANQVLNCGTQYLADGSTSISSTDATNNIGIFVDNAATNADIVVRNNTVLDERATPYCNYALVPQSAQTSWVYWFNHMAGCRNAYNLLDHDPNTREISSTIRFDANTKHVAGATAGSSSASGTVAGFDINGAAGSARRHQVLTAGTPRWGFGGTGDTESGSNAGTNFTIVAYTDAGAVLSTPVTINRATGAVTLGAPLPVASGGTGSAVQNFVDLTTAQTVAGTKTFSSAPKVPGILDPNANTVLGITATASAVNYVSVQNNTTGNRPALVAGGSDTNVGITYKTQGTGTHVMRPGSDTTTAVAINNAANTTTVLGVDTTNTRVGIGKTAPSTALDVAGTATVTGLAMTTSPTAGYVLTSDSAGAATWQAAGVNGITPVHTGFTTFGTGGIINTLNASSGTSVAMVAGSIYWAAVLIPMSVTLTGVIVSVGATGGTDAWIGSLYSYNGALLANSALAGTTAGSANTKMKLPFTSTVTVTGPTVCYIALQSNGTTAKFLAFSNATEGFVTGSVTGTFGTLPTITPGTTYTQNVGPFANTY